MTPTKQKRRSTRLQLILAVTLCIFGCVLIISAFIIPPAGEIHNSVLVAFGEILTFSGSLIGIDYRYRYHSNQQKQHRPFQR